MNTMTLEAKMRRYLELRDELKELEAEFNIRPAKEGKPKERSIAWGEKGKLVKQGRESNRESILNILKQTPGGIAKDVLRRKLRTAGLSLTNQGVAQVIKYLEKQGKLTTRDGIVTYSFLIRNNLMGTVPTNAVHTV